MVAGALARAAGASNSARSQAGALRRQGVAVIVRSPGRRTPLRRRRPRACAPLRRGLVEDRVGVVDVDEQLARRGRQPAEPVAIMPPAPDCGRWPMLRPVLVEKPRRIISSSVQKVPSTSTASARLIASQTGGVDLAQTRRVEDPPAGGGVLEGQADVVARHRAVAVRRIGRGLALQRQRGDLQDSATPGSGSDWPSSAIGCQSTPQ